MSTTPIDLAGAEDPTRPEADTALRPGGAPRVRSRIFIKYVSLLVAVVGVAVLSNGVFEVLFYYREHKDSLIRIQHEQAEAAAAKIGQFVKEIENQIGWTTQLPWSAGLNEQRRFDALRLLRQVPAVTELTQIDASGKERLRVSRLAVDVLDSKADFSTDPKFTEAMANKVYYGPVYFRRESEPYMTLALAGTRKDAGVSAAEVNLKFIWDVVSRIKVGETGRAYVVGPEGRLIAHPDISLVLRNTDMSGLPQVRAALNGTGVGNELQGAPDIHGHQVLTAAAPIQPLRWTMFVELPVDEAYTSLYAALKRLALVLFAASAFAVLAGVFLAGRLVGPIRALGAGAARIGSGDLAHRISIKTGDELEGLANQFNDMGLRLQESYAGLEKKVEARTAELRETLEQQAATSEVLGIISSSPGDVAPVFDKILEMAIPLCGADFGVLDIYDGQVFQLAASRGLPAAFEAFRKAHALDFGPGTAPARLLGGEPFVEIADLVDAETYRKGDPNRRALVDLGGARCLLAVPLVKDDHVSGTLMIFRRERSPFTEKQIMLLQQFAAQAVIAIENARLLTELRQRTEELSLSLNELRTAQDRLVHTEKLASLGQLTAGIAHEIKNPLNFINNFASLSGELVDELRTALEPVGLDEDARQDIDELMQMIRDNCQKVVQHGRRADSIVKNMLMHSREGSGERRSADINTVVEESLHLAYHGARAEDPTFQITLARDLDESAGTIECFPQEISRVFLNLISNGFYAATKRKATAANGFEPTVKVATRSLGRQVEVRIRDNGTGIPPDVREKIFNPFFTTKPTGEGTGLGLSISHDIIVKQHGGSIDVETEPDAFTEFIIVLPRSFPATAMHAGARN